jgi:branched-chain amino acid aminotransferase
MNLFLVTARGELITPGLGTILDGVIRDSVLQLAVEHGLKPAERQVSLDDLRAGCADGSITEMFAAGTAAVITPILEFRGNGYRQPVGGGRPGTATLEIRSHILDIQYGRSADPRNWTHRVM